MRMLYKPDSSDEVFADLGDLAIELGLTEVDEVESNEICEHCGCVLTGYSALKDENDNHFCHWTDCDCMLEYFEVHEEEDLGEDDTPERWREFNQERL